MLRTTSIIRFSIGPKQHVRNFAFVPASAYEIKKPDEFKQGKSLVDILKTIKGSDLLKQKAETTKSKQLVTVPTSSTVLDAIKLMSDSNVGSILITNKNELIGIFTERDYIRKIILKKQVSKNTTIESVMSQPVVSATPETNLFEISSLMAINKFRHVPIVSSSGIEGVISTRDIIPELVKSCESSSLDLDARISKEYNKLCRTTSPECFVRKDDTVYHALQLMEKHKGGAVFVYKGTRLEGIFTERDYLKKVYLQGRSSHETKIGQVMTRHVVSVSPTQTVKECLEVMRDNKVRNVPVVPLLGDSIDYSEGYEYDYSTIGMITDLDVVKYIHKKI